MHEKHKLPMTVLICRWPSVIVEMTFPDGLYRRPLRAPELFFGGSNVRVTTHKEVGSGF